MAILIFANGELKQKKWLKPFLEDATSVIAADGGAHHTLSLGITPDVLIGDFDSIKAEALSRVEAAGADIVAHPLDKDETDLELALLWAVEHFQEDIIILAALGGRLDQSLSNIMLLAHPKLAGRAVEIRERDQRVWLISGESQIDGSTGDLVSLVPLGSDILVQRTSGLRWALNDEMLLFGLSRGVSNVMTADKASVALRSGQLLCIHTTREP